MKFRDKLLDARQPLILFEMVPPVADKAGALEAAVEDARRVHGRVDAFNLPEIRDESRGVDRTYKFVPRVEPRTLGGEIYRRLGAEVVLNRCVVCEPDQLAWWRETQEMAPLSNVILVGGESSEVRYPGPNVAEAARQILASGTPATLGGITLPNRAQEAERVRRKQAAGLRFFTTQILFDSNDIVWLIQRLNGLEARVFLSFAPVSHPRDVQFLRWLGADVPAELDEFLIQNAEGTSADNDAKAERSLDLAQRILMDVFDNLPPDPPPLGLNIEHINRRNFASAVRMVERLGHLYSNLLAARGSPSRG